MFDPQFHLRMPLFLRQINPQKSAKLELRCSRPPDLEHFLKQYHDAEEKLQVSGIVQHVVHLLAIDEDRALFFLHESRWHP